MVGNKASTCCWLRVLTSRRFDLEELGRPAHGCADLLSLKAELGLTRIALNLGPPRRRCRLLARWLGAAKACEILEHEVSCHPVC